MTKQQFLHFFALKPPGARFSVFFLSQGIEFYQEEAHLQKIMARSTRRSSGGGLVTRRPNGTTLFVLLQTLAQYDLFFLLEDSTTPFTAAAKKFYCVGSSCYGPEASGPIDEEGFSNLFTADRARKPKHKRAKNYRASPVELSARQRKAERVSNADVDLPAGLLNTTRTPTGSFEDTEEASTFAQTEMEMSLDLGLEKLDFQLDLQQEGWLMDKIHTLGSGAKKHYEDAKSWVSQQAGKGKKATEKYLQKYLQGAVNITNAMTSSWNGFKTFLQIIADADCRTKLSTQFASMFVLSFSNTKRYPHFSKVRDAGKTALKKLNKLLSKSGWGLRKIQEIFTTVLFDPLKLIAGVMQDIGRLALDFGSTAIKNVQTLIEAYRKDGNKACIQTDEEETVGEDAEDEKNAADKSSKSGFLEQGKKKNFELEHVQRSSAANTGVGAGRVAVHSRSYTPTGDLFGFTPYPNVTRFYGAGKTPNPFLEVIGTSNSAAAQETSTSAVSTSAFLNLQSDDEADAEEARAEAKKARVKAKRAEKTADDADRTAEKAEQKVTRRRQKDQAHEAREKLDRERSEALLDNPDEARRLAEAKDNELTPEQRKQAQEQFPEKKVYTMTDAGDDPADTFRKCKKCMLAVSLVLDLLPRELHATVGAMVPMAMHMLYRVSGATVGAALNSFLKVGHGMSPPTLTAAWALRFLNTSKSSTMHMMFGGLRRATGIELLEEREQKDISDVTTALTSDKGFKKVLVHAGVQMLEQSPVCANAAGEVDAGEKTKSSKADKGSSSFATLAEGQQERRVQVEKHKQADSPDGDAEDAEDENAKGTHDDDALALENDEDDDSDGDDEAAADDDAKVKDAEDPEQEEQERDDGAEEKTSEKPTTSNQDHDGSLTQYEDDKGNVQLQGYSSCKAAELFGKTITEQYVKGKNKDLSANEILSNVMPVFNTQVLDVVEGGKEKENQKVDKALEDLEKEVEKAENFVGGKGKARTTKSRGDEEQHHRKKKGGAVAGKTKQSKKKSGSGSSEKAEAEEGAGRRRRRRSSKKKEKSLKTTPATSSDDQGKEVRRKEKERKREGSESSLLQRKASADEGRNDEERNDEDRSEAGNPDGRDGGAGEEGNDENPSEQRNPDDRRQERGADDRVQGRRGRQERGHRRQDDEQGDPDDHEGSDERGDNGTGGEHHQEDHDGEERSPPATVDCSQAEEQLEKGSKKNCKKLEGSIESEEQINKEKLQDAEKKLKDLTEQIEKGEAGKNGEKKQRNLVKAHKAAKKALKKEVAARKKLQKKYHQLQEKLEQALGQQADEKSDLKEKIEKLTKKNEQLQQTQKALGAVADGRA
ncbi:unnamed protein product, partial [Amoebophrya sp. A120]|eukprot:GSA120T00022524001.1